MADMLAAITGMSPEECAGFLEMAGGDVETAVSLYYSMQDGGGGGGGGTTQPSAGGGATPASAGPTSPAHRTLFGTGAVPDAWLDQGFEFSSDANSACGINQHKNGPCGALACVNAEVIAVMKCPMPNTPVPDVALASALARILWRCAGGGPIVLAKWVAEPGGDIAEEPLDAASVGDADALAQALLPQVPTSLRARGGCCLFCYSCILTHGVDKVAAEAAMEGGATPLVSGPFSLCGTELISLLLCGVARANVGAYGAGGGKKVSWRVPGEVGLISADEIESGVPLADGLKSPTLPVWVLHGGDHFTCVWHPSNGPAAVQQRLQGRVQAIFAAMTSAGGGGSPNEVAVAAFQRAREEAQADPTNLPTSGDGYFDLCHWNGLPPSRGIGWLRVRACGSDATAAAPGAPEVHTPTHWRLTVGEVESIVQAAADDKKRAPGVWKDHKYEISLVTARVAEDDKASPERPAGAPPPLRLEQGPKPPAGAAWRCASCYSSRFSTMCFGENPSPAGESACALPAPVQVLRPDAGLCKFCGQTQEDAGWTRWMHYAELPEALQRRVDRMNGPKILKTLRTRWPAAEVAVFPGDTRAAAEAELGSAAFDPKRFHVPAA